MDWKRIGGLILASVLSHFHLPESFAAVPFASVDQERRAKNATAPDGKALIYVYRGDMSGAAELPVYLNGRFSLNTASGSFVMWVASPGRYVVSSSADMGSGLSLRAEAGQSYFIRQDASTAGGSAFAVSTTATGRYSIASRRLVDLVAAAKQGPAATQSQAAPPVRKAEPARPRTIAPAARRVRHQDWAVLLRSGSFDIVNESQTIAGVGTNFDLAATGIFGIEGQYRMPQGYAFGAEALLYDGVMTRAIGTGTGTMSVTALMANAYKYFDTGTDFYPYLGAGVGAALVSFSGSVVSGDTSGMATQVLLGAEWRFESAGIFIEWRKILADTEDDLGNKASASIRGITGGVNFRF